MTLTVVGVNVTNNSPSRDYSQPDDQTTQTTETPGFKPFTDLPFVLCSSRFQIKWFVILRASCSVYEQSCSVFIIPGSFNF